MQIELQVNKDFERYLEELRREFGEEFEFINGIHPSQLDNSAFLGKFVNSSTLADTSIDPNANANHRDIRSFMTEKGKSSDKLFALSKIFYEIKKKYGLRTAKAWLRQEFSKGFYLNDSATSSFFPYCWANDLTRLAREGLFFLGNYNNKPAKHLSTFLDDVIEFVSFLSNRQSGAVGLPNILIWSWWFWKVDCETGHYIKSPEYYLKQCFQKLIFRLNQPFLRIDQCAFTNVSIFDRKYLEALFGGLEFPDGAFAIDHIEDLIDCQKIFMEVVAEVRKDNMFTFPVITTSLLYADNEFKDEEFARWACYHNMKWYDSNFFISDNVGVLSNCPLSGDTKILYWSDYYKEYKLSPIKEVYHNKLRDNNQIIKVISNGEEIKCKINQFDIPIQYEIELINGATIKTTANHLNKVYGKDFIKTKDLTVNDYLPYSLHCFNNNDLMTYEDGKLVGMFLGDGSYKNNNEITLSLNKNTDKDDIDFIYDYCPKHFGAKITTSNNVSSISGNDLCVNVNINSSYLKGLISQFVEGDNVLNKKINYRCLNCSKDFRQGIIDGIYTTDGGNSNRIYTSSEQLKDSLIVLFASLGIVTNVTTDERDGRLGDNINYVIRYYTPNGRKSLKDVYIVDDDYMWIKIKSIKKIKSTHKSYCLEVLEDVEPIFMLGNGVITHNCRLLSDTSKLSGFVNSIGGTALSIGSCRVSTINLVRIAYETKCNKKKYLELLKDRVILDCKALDCMRHIIERNIEKGLLPNYQEGAVELSKQYATIGILGMFEVMDLFGLIDTDELGYKYYSEEAIQFATEIFGVIDGVKDNFECDFTFNVESIPAENCAGVICNADRLLFEEANKYFIYSNQWIPLMEKCSIQEKCRVSSILDPKCGGGSIAHIDVENRFPTKEAAWDMLQYIAKMGVIYSAFTTKINVCKNNHSYIGSKSCPICGEKEPKDTFARVVGFYTPVSNYQQIRKQEFDRRRWYHVLENDMVM